MTLLDEAASVQKLSDAAANVLKARLKKPSKRYSRHHLLKKAKALRKRYPYKGLLEVMDKEIRSAMGELSKEIGKGRYSRQPLFIHREPKPDGGTRFIMIHARLEEKMVEKSVYSVVAPKLRELLDNGRSFCGIPADKKAKKKLGIFSAHRGITDLFKTNDYWIVKADIEKFFDKLDRKIVIELLKKYLPDDSLMGFFEDWVNIQIQNPSTDYKLSDVGIPQGSCLSGLIANLYLVGFDKGHSQIEGITMFRYADDLFFACETEAQAKKIDGIAQKFLADIGLKFKESKFDIFAPGQPFAILGYAYNENLISVEDKKLDDWIASLGEDFKQIGKVAYRIAQKKGLRKTDIEAMTDAQDRIYSKLISYDSMVKPEKQVPGAVNKKKAHYQANEKMVKYLRAAVKGINRIVDGRFMYLPEFKKKNKAIWPYFVPRIARTFMKD